VQPLRKLFRATRGCESAADDREHGFAERRIELPERAAEIRFAEPEADGAAVCAAFAHGDVEYD
jgi:hypothetical protein